MVAHTRFQQCSPRFWIPCIRSSLNLLERTRSMRRRKAGAHWVCHFMVQHQEKLPEILLTTLKKKLVEFHQSNHQAWAPVLLSQLAPISNNRF